MNRRPEGSAVALETSAAVHHTEVGEIRAAWCLHGQTIRILQVYTATGFLLSASDTPDLAKMRERLPNLRPLWDEVRQQFWTYVAHKDTPR